MSAKTDDDLIVGYMVRLDRALADLPRARREEIVDEIRSHVDEAYDALENPDAAAVLGLLDRVGDPDDIAAEARDRFGVAARPRAGVMEVAALVLLPIGGVIIPVLGWVAGVALLWASRVWTTRDKLLGTLLVPGGLAGAVYLLFAAGGGQTCSGGVDAAGNTWENCTGGPTQIEHVLLLTTLVVATLGPIISVVYLSARMHRRAIP